MSHNLVDELKSPLEQELLLEEKKYQEALKADAEFEVLKATYQRMKQLKATIVTTEVKG
jgi:adenosyl cobinamide kinase/adenosyl cobinamide phosphate guanylyltransferase